MSRKTSQIQSHRFVVVFRREAREIENATEVWRGWVERIPSPRQKEIDHQEDDRLDFQSLEELPKLIARLIERSNAPEKRP